MVAKKAPLMLSASETAWMSAAWRRARKAPMLTKPLAMYASPMARNRPLTARIAASAPASSWAASAGHNILSDSGAVPVGSVTTRRRPMGSASATIGMRAISPSPRTAAIRRSAPRRSSVARSWGTAASRMVWANTSATQYRPYAAKNASVSVDFPKKFAISSASTPPSTVAPAYPADIAAALLTSSEPCALFIWSLSRRVEAVAEEFLGRPGDTLDCPPGAAARRGERGGPGS